VSGADNAPGSPRLSSPLLFDSTAAVYCGPVGVCDCVMRRSALGCCAVANCSCFLRRVREFGGGSVGGKCGGTPARRTPFFYLVGAGVSGVCGSGRWDVPRRRRDPPAAVACAYGPIT
jgi:hypothetical protein